MAKLIFLGVFVFSQLSFASQLTSVARVDLTKTTAVPSSPLYFGPALEFKMIKTVVAEQVIWTGYEKEYICIGDRIQGPDGDSECATDEVLTWVPRVKLPVVKEILRASVMTETGYDEQVHSTTGEYTLPRTCIQNFESYRYFGSQAPSTANAQLTISSDCAVYLLDNTIFYYEQARSLKGNYLSASLYRSGLLKLNLAQPLALSANTPVTLPSQPVIEMKAQVAGEYPVLTLLGLTPNKQHNLFGESYLYPALKDQ